MFLAMKALKLLTEQQPVDVDQDNRNVSDPWDENKIRQLFPLPVWLLLHKCNYPFKCCTSASSSSTHDVTTAHICC